jgi:hypothetical protein
MTFAFTLNKPQNNIGIWFLLEETFYLHKVKFISLFTIENLDIQEKKNQLLV